MVMQMMVLFRSGSGSGAWRGRGGGGGGSATTTRTTVKSPQSIFYTNTYMIGVPLCLCAQILHAVIVQDRSGTLGQLGKRTATYIITIRTATAPCCFNG